MDADGELAAAGSVAGAHFDGCPACGPAAGQPDCDASAVGSSITLPPGTYTVHGHSDAADAPDLLSVVTIAPATDYTLCYRTESVDR